MLSPNTEQTTHPSTDTPKPPAQNEHRRIQRISLPLPARVEVKIDSDVSWNEITRLSDVSSFGAGFVLKRPVKRGRLVLMTIPMPRQLRSFDFSEPQYRVWAAVRRCISVGRDVKNPEYSVGVAFIGKSPPSNYVNNPAQLYDISHREEQGEGFWKLIPALLDADESHLPPDVRKQSRFSIPEALLLQMVDESGNVIESEMTVTENISVGGAALMTSLKIKAGTFIRVTSERFDVRILSVVRGSRVGTDGITRLHIEFIDRLFPLEGIS
ncbi:MAG: hypothetical protein ABIV48_03180 [Pyrinomonadaceae bacterium]